MKTQINFTRINNDVNGNPRYVCHFLDIPINKEEQDVIDNAGLNRTNTYYNIALAKAKTIGGKKFHNKQYGGGIVFQSYNIQQTEQDILNLK